MKENKPASMRRRELLLSLLAAGVTLPFAFKISNVFGKDGSLTVGFSIWDLSIPFAVPLANALKDVAAKNNIKLKLVEARFDASQQAQQISEFIVQNVDVICATPVDVRGIIPAARSASKAGIPFIACLGQVEGYPYIGADDVEYGKQMGHLILQALESMEFKGPYKIAFLRGLAGGAPDRLRYEGIMSVISSRQDISVVAEIETEWNPDKALSGTQTLLQKFSKGDLHLIHGWGGMVEVPAARYTHVIAKRTEIIFTGGELTKQTKEAVENGWEYGVVIQDPTTVGNVTMNALPAMAPDFKTVPTNAVVPLPICTKNNLSSFTPF